MQRRSTNTIGYTHHGGDITAHVNSSHGVRLTGGSTGGIVESVGDDTNVTLTIRAQGAGGIVLGTSSNGVSIPGPSTFTGTQFRVQGASSIVLSPTSTAGITIGNSTNENPIAITGSSVAVNSTHVHLNSTRVQVAGSTTYFAAMRRVRIDFTVPVMAANAGAEEGDITVAGLTTNACILLAPRGVYNSSVAGVAIKAFCSTAGQMHLTYHNAGTSISGSTMSAYALIFETNIPA